jgi:hypothetical protein
VSDRPIGDAARTLVPGGHPPARRLRKAEASLREALPQLDDDGKADAKLFIAELEDIRVRDASKLEPEIADVRGRIAALAERVEPAE